MQYCVIFYGPETACGCTFVADKKSGHYINPKLICSTSAHTDFVKAIDSMDLRIYSGG